MSSRRERRRLFYPGFVWVSKKLDRWISDHRSFAGYAWFHSQVKYSYSEWEEIGPDTYEILPQVSLGRETITIRIRFTRYPEGGPDYPRDYVRVWGAHIVRSKRRRR